MRGFPSLTDSYDTAKCLDGHSRSVSTSPEQLDPLLEQGRCARGMTCGHHAAGGKWSAALAEKRKAMCGLDRASDQTPAWHGKHAGDFPSNGFNYLTLPEGTCQPTAAYRSESCIGICTFRAKIVSNIEKFT